MISGGYSKQKPTEVLASTAFETSHVERTSAGGITRGTVTTGQGGGTRPISAYPVNGFNRKSMNYDHSIGQSKALPIHHS